MPGVFLETRLTVSYSRPAIQYADAPAGTRDRNRAVLDKDTVHIPSIQENWKEQPVSLWNIAEDTDWLEEVNEGFLEEMPVWNLKLNPKTATPPIQERISIVSASEGRIRTIKCAPGIFSPTCFKCIRILWPPWNGVFPP